MIVRWRAAVAILAIVVTACTASDDSTANNNNTTTQAEPPASAVGYELDVSEQGDEPRLALAAPVPVGRTVTVRVVFESRGERVTVVLEAEVTASVAGGGGKQVAMVVVAVEADDADTVAALDAIVGASSALVLDERRAVVEQSLFVPQELTFRADTIVGQALRAPFSLAGPLPSEPVGAGAAWSVADATSGMEVVAVRVDTAGYRLQVETAEASVETEGAVGALLPSQQVITLEDSTLTVLSERSS